jgi:putative membrane protein
MMGYYGWMGGLGGFGMIVGMVLWLAVIVLLVWGISRLFVHPTTDARAEALEILKRRFAAGELTAAEFETARRALA